MNDLNQKIKEFAGKAYQIDACRYWKNTDIPEELLEDMHGVFVEFARLVAEDCVIIAYQTIEPDGDCCANNILFEYDVDNTPAQFSGVLEDEIDEFELEEFTKLIEEYHSRKIDSEFQQWKNVFGHLGTPDECGNAWIELIEQRDSLLNALIKIYNRDSHSIELALDYGSIGVRDFYRKIARTEIDKNDRPFGFRRAQPTRESLTDEWIRMICDKCDAETGEEFIFAFARVIERAHEIGCEK